MKTPFSLSILASVALVSAMIPGVAASSTPAPEVRTTAVQVTSGKPKPQKYHVSPGVTLTNPLNDTHAAIFTKILRVIAHTPKGSTIRLASWNFDSHRYVDALSRAHARGVSVRLLMARTMTNPKFATLRRNLQGSGNANRPPEMRSWARTCNHSCRGNGGSMHAKYYIFSRSGQSKHIVMNSSANLTAASASVQWNDLYTTVDRKPIYKQYMRAFRESVRDKAAPYIRFQDKEIVGFFFPLGKKKHPAMEMLDKVTCHGAKGAGTRDGRTIIRAAQDVFNNQIGLNIALKLRQLYRRGCDVKVIYSQAVGASKSVIRSMPHNHLVQDRDGDCAYDRYLHAKVLSISGRYGDKRGERIVLNGSGNWSGTAVRSDEQGMIINRSAAERLYGAWISSMFHIHLTSAPCDPDLADDDDEEQRLASGRIDPYANMEG